MRRRATPAAFLLSLTLALGCGSVETKTTTITQRGTAASLRTPGLARRRRAQSRAAPRRARHRGRRPLPSPSHRLSGTRSRSGRTQGADGRLRPPTLRQLHEADVASVDPKVIVIHYTETPSFRRPTTPSRRTPRPRAPRAAEHVRALRDRPRRRIHQLVPLNIMCRHTVGLNWTAIGIEHVGYSDPKYSTTPPDGRQPAARALAALPPPHHDRQRDRPQREPIQPVPPRGRARAAHPDARRLRPRRHADLPRRLAAEGGCA